MKQIKQFLRRLDSDFNSSDPNYLTKTFVDLSTGETINYENKSTQNYVIETNYILLSYTEGVSQPS